MRKRSLPRVVHAKAEDFVPTLPESSVDAIVTDPPYGLTDLPPHKVGRVLGAWLSGDPWFVPDGRGLVGNRWDRFVPPPGLWAELVRVLKPGGHALVFASARTVDLMGVSCRLGGFEVRDSIAWLNAQAMPKSLNLGKAFANQGLDGEAARWAGWGTGLRVSNEPILVLRKPIEQTVTSNVAVWGTGGLNIDATRTPSSAGVGRWPTNAVLSHHPDCELSGTKQVQSNSHYPAARGAGGATTSGHRGQSDLVERRPRFELVSEWDCHEGCPVRELDRQSGVLSSGTNPTWASGGHSVSMAGPLRGGVRVAHRGADCGSASRFFPVFRYHKKAGRGERPVVDGFRHPSVKPVGLVRWLVRLLGAADRGDGCPSLFLDPFAGSGSTGEACWLEGFDSVLVESDVRSVGLVRSRLEGLVS